MPIYACIAASTRYIIFYFRVTYTYLFIYCALTSVDLLLAEPSSSFVAALQKQDACMEAEDAIRQDPLGSFLEEIVLVLSSI